MPEALKHTARSMAANEAAIQLWGLVRTGMGEGRRRARGMFKCRLHLEVGGLVVAKRRVGDSDDQVEWKKMKKINSK